MTEFNVDNEELMRLAVNSVPNMFFQWLLKSPSLADVYINTKSKSSSDGTRGTWKLFRKISLCINVMWEMRQNINGDRNQKVD